MNQRLRDIASRVHAAICHDSGIEDGSALWQDAWQEAEIAFLKVRERLERFPIIRDSERYTSASIGNSVVNEICRQRGRPIKGRKKHDPAARTDSVFMDGTDSAEDWVAAHRADVWRASSLSKLNDVTDACDAIGDPLNHRLCELLQFFDVRSVAAELNLTVADVRRRIETIRRFASGGKTARRATDHAEREIHRKARHGRRCSRFRQAAAANTQPHRKRALGPGRRAS